MDAVSGFLPGALGGYSPKNYIIWDPARRELAARALAEELECSERTVYRYLDVLKFAGVPYYREEPQEFGRVRPDCGFPILTLTEDEALGQALATAATNAPGLNDGSIRSPGVLRRESKN